MTVLAPDIPTFDLDLDREYDDRRVRAHLLARDKYREDFLVTPWSQTQPPFAAYIRSERHRVTHVCWPNTRIERHSWRGFSYFTMRSALHDHIVPFRSPRFPLLVLRTARTDDLWRGPDTETFWELSDLLGRKFESFESDSERLRFWERMPQHRRYEEICGSRLRLFCERLVEPFFYLRQRRRE